MSAVRQVWDCSISWETSYVALGNRLNSRDNMPKAKGFSTPRCHLARITNSSVSASNVTHFQRSLWFTVLNVPVWKNIASRCAGLFTVQLPARPG